MAESFKLPDGESIAVLAGRETFHIHKAVVTRSSELFKNATKPHWTTDPSKPIDLSDQKHQLFMAYAQWLYTGVMPHDGKDRLSYKYLASMYVFGETIMDGVLQKSILKAVIKLYVTSEYLPSYSAIQIIYRGTNTKSPARRLMVDFCTYDADPDWPGLDTMIGETCPEFVNDLIPTLLKNCAELSKGVARPWVADPRVVP